MNIRYMFAVLFFLQVQTGEVFADCNYYAMNEITIKWNQNPFLGNPTSGFIVLSKDKACLKRFQGGNIYNTDTYGSHEVHGAIMAKWSKHGWENGFLGYPTTDETTTPDGIGRFNHFEHGSIYWTAAVGAHEVHGMIRNKWKELGWEKSYLGYPTTDETSTPDGIGRFNHFEHGSIYYHPTHGTHPVPISVFEQWKTDGYEKGFYGYPVEDPVCNDLFFCTQQFENGVISSNGPAGLTYCNGDNLTGNCAGAFEDFGMTALFGLKSVKVWDGWMAWACPKGDFSTGKCKAFYHLENYTNKNEYNYADIQTAGLAGKDLKFFIVPYSTSNVIKYYNSKKGRDGSVGFSILHSTKYENGNNKEMRYTTLSAGENLSGDRKKFLYFGNSMAREYVNPKDGVGVTTSNFADIKVDISQHEGVHYGRPYKEISDISTAPIPSFTMYVSNDTAMNNHDGSYAELTCDHMKNLFGNYLNPVDGAVKCNNPGSFTFNDVDIAGGNTFIKSTDLFDLVWLQGHGWYDAVGGAGMLPLNKGGSGIHFFHWGVEAGKHNMKWMVTGACLSMGENNIPITDVIRTTYEPALQRLHGVGGMRNNSTWTDDDTYHHTRFGNRLYANKIMSESFVYQMYRKNNRDPWFITIEEKDCVPNRGGTYMFYDGFFHQLPDKEVDAEGNLLPKYKYYCQREMINWDHKADGDIFQPSFFNSNMRKNSSVDLYKTVLADSLVFLNNNFLKIDQTTLEIKKKGSAVEYKSKDAVVLISGRQMSFIKRRDVEFMTNSVELDENKKTYFKEKAFEIASSLTSLDLRLTDIAKDQATSFVKEGAGIKKLNSGINKVLYVYKPLINGVEINNAFIEIEFDGKGLYSVTSTSPSDIKFIKKIELKDFHSVSNELKILMNNKNAELNPSDVRFSIDNRGLISPVYLYENKNKELIKLIPLNLDPKFNPDFKSIIKLNVVPAESKRLSLRERE